MLKGKSIQPVEMRCISRRSKDPDGPLAWRVMVSRSRGKLLFQKYFFDHRYGGEAEALAAAKAWRDDVVNRFPRTSKAELSAQLRKHNTSGNAGVYRKKMPRRSRNGAIVIHVVWQAQTPLSVVPFRSRSFSVAKYGEQEAYRRAVEARKEFEALLGVPAMVGETRQLMAEAVQ